MTDDEIAIRIREAVESEIAEGGGDTVLTESTPLLGSGAMDSLGTMNLVGCLEDEFGVSIAAHEINTDNFNYLADIVALVKSKVK